MYYHEWKTYKDGPFDIKISYGPEDTPVADFFDDTVSDIKEMERKLERGDAVHFIAKVEAFYNGHEVGSTSLGSNYYESPTYEEDALEEGLGGYLNDMIDEVKEQAFKEIALLKNSIMKDFTQDSLETVSG